MAKDRAFPAGYLAEILRILQASDVRELEIRDGETRVRVHRLPSAEGDRLVLEGGTRDVLSEPETAAREVKAPLVGTFYRAERPGAPPLVAEGSPVDEHTRVGIIEALHVLTDVEAGCAGVVTRVLATDGHAVQYGQPLFEVAASG